MRKRIFFKKHAWVKTLKTKPLESGLRKALHLSQEVEVSDGLKLIRHIMLTKEYNAQNKTKKEHFSFV